jgi:hypothetical protein
MKRANFRKAVAVAVGFAGLVAVIAVTVLPSGASTPNAVRLHLRPDGRYFAYGSDQQPLTPAKNGCQIISAEPIIDLSSLPGGSSPGLGPDAIGVKQSPSSGNGSPCQQVESTETLRIARGPNLGTRRFVGLRLDLEMTGDALVKLTLTSGSTNTLYQLQTGHSITPDQTAEPGYAHAIPYIVTSGPGDEIDACAAPNSSGPNSSASDNCEWVVTPGFAFDSFTLTTPLGTVGLEGGNDFGTDPSFDTFLYLANTPPTAHDDSFTTNEDTALNQNVLTNDTDPDDNPLSASLVSGPSHGSLTLLPTGAFTYTPAHDYNGADSFVYAASDGIDTSQATAHITVAPVNDPPVAVSGPSTTPEDTAVTVTVATDVDSTALTSSCTSSAGGTIVDNGDGTVTFTPPANFNGTITLTCTTTDDHGATTSSSAIVTVGVTPVNDPPVANDDTADVDESSSVVVAVLANDTDVDGDTLGVTDVGSATPAGATAVGNPDGTVTYTPPVGYTGPGSFTYRATDGTATSNVATASVTVFPVICSLDSVSDTDGDVTGTFTRLSDPFQCKRYLLEAVADADAILFQPTGDATVTYRGELTFGPEPAPPAGGSGVLPLLLRYDPDGGTNFRPVQWCSDQQFDADGLVITATLPAGESWCVASADTRGTGPDVETVWQVFGIDDPNFSR